ncbi:MAG: acyltransferase [Bacteroidales bacterium]|nr:acyltransferase [Bacteroidales bacterium]
MEIFHYQARENTVYRDYINFLGIDIQRISNSYEIPFLPIGFFKNHKIISGIFDEEIVFTSSGTSGMQRSKHYIRNLELCKKSFINAFRVFYGEPAEYRFLALLPSYLEREGSSLVFMVEELIRAGGYAESGFFLYEHDQLADKLKIFSSDKTKVILIGVSFALLDFATQYSFPVGKNIILMETGGMKGRKEEITRAELHKHLCNAFQLKSIHSEYGMTELLSQAYSTGDGRFIAPPWMKVIVRDIQDPFQILPEGKTGAINIIDLANIHSCAFIETQDIGKLHPDGSFEVLGRTDSSDVRGCSLLFS